MRSEIKRMQGRIVFADHYNANPSSMEAALTVLVSMKSSRKAVAVLGDMLELGTSSAKAHFQIGGMAARLGVDILVALGELSKYIAEGAVAAGMPKERVFEAQTHHSAAMLLRTLSSPGDVVLVKGSRGMQMEKILEEF